MIIRASCDDHAGSPPREHGRPGAEPIPWHRQEVDVHRRCSICVLVRLSVELGIALDGLECTRQNDDRHPWTESTRTIVKVHTQPSQPRDYSLSHRSPEGCTSPRHDARPASLAYEDGAHDTRVLHPSGVRHLWSLALLTQLSLRYILHSIQWVLIDHGERASSMRGRTFGP
jgi:hypothetical protein